MSYCRFSEDSDVYVFEHVDGFLRCCMCRSVEHPSPQNFDAGTDRGMVNHLRWHQRMGDNVPDHVFEQLTQER